MAEPSHVYLGCRPATARLGLDDPKWSDEQLLDFMVAYPILMNRPVVVTKLGTKLCRPAEEVLSLLPTGKPQER